MLYRVSHKTNIKKEDFAKQWLTLAAIKDAMWTSRNLLVSKRMQISPCSCDPDGSGNGANSRKCKRQAKDTAEMKHRLCAHSEDGAGATHKKVKAAVAWLSGCGWWEGARRGGAPLST